MNKTSLILATLLGAAAITAQANELYTPDSYQSPSSAVTRDQVKASVLRAQKAGELRHTDVDQPDYDVVVFGKTRAQVKGEVLAARREGSLDHDDVDLPNVAKNALPTRGQVRENAIAARKLVNTAPGRNTIDY